MGNRGRKELVCPDEPQKDLAFLFWISIYCGETIQTKSACICWDCRKSPNVMILANSHIVKSTTCGSPKAILGVFRQPRYRSSVCIWSKLFRYDSQLFNWSSWFPAVIVKSQSRSRARFVGATFNEYWEFLCYPLRYSQITLPPFLSFWAGTYG